MIVRIIMSISFSSRNSWWLVSRVELKMVTMVLLEIGEWGTIVDGIEYMHWKSGFENIGVGNLHFIFGALLLIMQTDLHKWSQVPCVMFWSSTTTHSTQLSFTRLNYQIHP